MGSDATPKALFALASPAEDAVLDWLRSKISRLALEEIAANDRGEDAAKHFAAIQAQLGARPPLGSLRWWPREVLELERWNEPDRGRENTPHSGERGHVKRLLACTILLRNAGYVSVSSRDFYEKLLLETSAASLVRFTHSALALKIPERALGFMLWLLEAQPDPALRPFMAFCVLALASAIGFGKLSQEEISQICDWVESEEEECRNILGYRVTSERWLVGLSSYESARGRDKPWSQVAGLAFDRRRKAHSAKTNESLRRFSERLAKK